MSGSIGQFSEKVDGLSHKAEGLYEEALKLRGRISGLENSTGATITYFPKPPVELRVRIWNQSIRPRLVAVHYYPKGDITCDPEDDAQDKYQTSCPVRAILPVCRESRNEGLEVYELIFASHNCIPRTYFSFARETVFVEVCFEGHFSGTNFSNPKGFFENLIGDTDVSKFEFIAVSYMCGDHYPGLESLVDQLRPLTNLKKIVLVVENQPTCRTRDTDELVEMSIHCEPKTPNLFF